MMVRRSVASLALPLSLVAILGGLSGLGGTGCSKKPEPASAEPPKSTAPGVASVTGGASSGAVGVTGLPPGHPPVGSGGASAVPAAPAAFGGDEIAWDAPSAWAQVPNASSMRKATYKIPKVAGDTEDAELSVTVAGGGVDPNIERWSQQFEGSTPKKEPRQPNGLKVTVVELKGKFGSAGGMGAPREAKDKQMLLGAIVDSGDHQTFFKMVGPEKTVTAAKKDFDKLVASLRAK